MTPEQDDWAGAPEYIDPAIENKQLRSRIAALEVLVKAADGLAGEAQYASALLHNIGMDRPILDTALATYRAAKEASHE